MQESNGPKGSMESTMEDEFMNAMPMMSGSMMGMPMNNMPMMGGMIADARHDGQCRHDAHDDAHACHADEQHADDGHECP